MRRFIVSLSVVLFLGFGTAQSLLGNVQQSLSSDAVQALQEAENAMNEALNIYSTQYPDRPLWQQAINKAREAQALAPEHPAPLRALAIIYSRANWYGPAWDNWLAYLGTGSDIDAEAAPVFVTVGNQLAFSRYEQGDAQTALGYYQRVIDEVPYDINAYVWSGRILLEQGQPEQAVVYWEVVAARDVTDARADYFLALARDQVRWGADAVNAFREGLELYEQRGAVDEAADAFAQAANLAPDYTEANAWAGRALLESRRPAQAVPFWQAVVAQDPSFEGASYFLRLSQEQANWGVDAVNAFQEGVGLYNESNLLQAKERFARATSLNGNYAEAWAWLGRVSFEQSQFAEARSAYETASRLEPGNEAYSYFYNESVRRLGN